MHHHDDSPTLLPHKWTFWYSPPYIKTPKTASTVWKSNYTQICEITSVQDFKSILRVLKTPKELLTGSTMGFFRDDIPPNWEHEKNMQGGKWIIDIFAKEHTTDETFLDRIWRKSLELMICGDLEYPNSKRFLETNPMMLDPNPICGIEIANKGVPKRDPDDMDWVDGPAFKFSMWTSQPDRGQNEDIGRTWRKAVGQGAKDINYVLHNSRQHSVLDSSDNRYQPRPYNRQHDEQNNEYQKHFNNRAHDERKRDEPRRDNYRDRERSGRGASSRDHSSRHDSHPERKRDGELRHPSRRHAHDSSHSREQSIDVETGLVRKMSLEKSPRRADSLMYNDSSPTNSHLPSRTHSHSRSRPTSRHDSSSRRQDASDRDEYRSSRSRY